MTIFYDYYKNPPQEGKEDKQLLHPRPVIQGKTLKTAYLAELISARSSFSSADIKGMLDNLAYAVLFGLRHGQNVHIEGFGTFSLSLTSRFVENVREIRSQSIEVKNIHFRPEKQLLENLKTVPLERVKEPRTPSGYIEERRLKRILSYIHQNEGIIITTAMKLNECNYKKAKNDLDKLLQMGMIKKNTFGKTAVYTRQDLPL